ncbi:MAG: branched-chain amino acid ABC transporter permease [Fervidicoccaceae archaeon]
MIASLQNILKRNYIFIAVILSFAIIPLIPSIETFYIDFLLLFFMYATVAESWNILSGYTGYSSFGHATFFGIGAYVSAILILTKNLPFFIDAIIGGITSGFVALLVGYPTLKLKGAYFAIATLTLGFISQIVFLNIQPSQAFGISLPLPPYSIRNFKIISYYSFFIVMMITIGITYFLDKTEIGLALKCIRDDEIGAQSIGINTTKYKMFAFLLSALFSGIAGGLYSYYATYIDPYVVFSPSISMYAIVMSIFGGQGTVFGPILGSFILFSVSQSIRYSTTFPGVDLMGFSLVAIAVILFMPEGIVGRIRKYGVRIA